MSDAKVIEGRVYLIPPRGLLAKLENVIYEKVAKKKGFKYLGNGFEIPSRKMKFVIDVVVDDDCEVCPLAIEYVSEIAGKYENVITKFYNASYVDPPFSISATPAFRINNRVKFVGLPLDPESMNRYFMEFLKEAYVMTHPKLKWLTDRLQRYAEANGFKRNPNDNSYLNILYKLLKNIDEYGHPYCPCRPLRKVAGATPEKIYELNKDKVCPCPYARMEVLSKGCCLCGLFWSDEKVDEYIKSRVKEYGWVIKEIERVQKALEELKKRVISGRGKVLAESIINKLQEIYFGLPD